MGDSLNRTTGKRLRAGHAAAIAVCTLGLPAALAGGAQVVIVP